MVLGGIQFCRLCSPYIYEMVSAVGICLTSDEFLNF